MKHRIAWTALAGLAAALAAVAVSARTQTFLETNQDQFDKGTSDGVVATTLGTLRLGRALEDLLPETEGVDYVARCAEGPDGALYAVTGAAGRIYRAKDGKVALYATLEDPYLFSVLADKNGDLYVGAGGTGRIWRITPPQGDQKEPHAEAIFQDDAVKYVWDLAWLPDGSMAAATGDQGRLLRIRPNGQHEVLIDSKADHVLCLAVAPDGTIYAGTDGDALVYRWAAGKAFVLYDAAENEVTALAADAQGNLYVAASTGTAGRVGGVTVQVQPTPKPPAAGGEEAKPAASKGNGGETPTPVLVAPDPFGVNAPAAEAQKVVHTVQSARPTAGPPGAPRPSRGGQGSSVYRLTPDGIATPLFDTEEPMILALAVAGLPVAGRGQGDRLLIGTGNPARLYEVTLARDGEEQARLAGLDPKQVMAISVTAAGRPVVATASPGRLYILSDGHAKEGTYTSQVYDAGGSARWGALDWRGRTPGGTEVRIATRTGNVADPEKGFWSDWSKDAPKGPAPVASPPARYIQFRVAMKTNNADQTPVLEQVEAAYLRANERPRILAIAEMTFNDREQRAQAVERFRQAVKTRNDNNKQKAGGSPVPPPPPEGSQPVRILKWQAEDPNGDTLVYRLYFRSQGESVWVLLEDDLTRPEYAWDTATVADGWYEIKIVASDAPDHPAEAALEDERTSDPILVDNTAPVIEDLKAAVRKEAGAGRAEVTFAARDAASRLTEAAYTVDSATEWRTIAPADMLFDAQRETFRFAVPDLAPGAHRIAVRAVDEANNRGHAAVTVVVEE